MSGGKFSSDIQEGLSVLIPVYNHICLPLATALSEQVTQVAQMEGRTDCELLFMDDGSSDEGIKGVNKNIARLPHCRYVEQAVNVGRAAIRNVLARTARYNHLLYLDCDVCVCHDSFLSDWLFHMNDADVVSGALAFDDVDGAFSQHLKYRYERHYLSAHPMEMRNAHPYQAFRTTHFMIRRDVMLRHPFDESFCGYGYEDTLLGRTLEENGVSLVHIGNSVCIADYEDNATFISKTEESLRTLADHEAQLNGYSALLSLYGKLCRWHIAPLTAMLLAGVNKVIRRNVRGNNPSVSLFNVYKLSYFMNMKKGS